MSVLDMMSEINFDPTFIKENQVILLNLDREKLANKNFRINERIFRDKMSLADMGRLNDSDPFKVGEGTKKVYDTRDTMNFKTKSEVVLKLNKHQD